MLFAVFVLTKKHPMLICQQANKLRALRGYNFRTVHSPINSIECHSYIKSDIAGNSYITHCNTISRSFYLVLVSRPCLFSARDNLRICRYVCQRSMHNRNMPGCYLYSIQKLSKRYVCLNVCNAKETDSCSNSLYKKSLQKTLLHFCKFSKQLIFFIDTLVAS